MDARDNILREALSLPKNDRADIASELLTSLDETSDDPALVEAAWLSEIDRRVRAISSGHVEDESWESVRERLIRRLSRP
jgi:putative addiction module component (TIGR02574 family)